MRLRVRLLKRAGIGFLLGIVIGNTITLLVTSPGQPVVRPEFAARMGGASSAALWQMLFFGLYGAAAMSGTILYELEDWSLLRCSAVHCLVICGLYPPMALTLGLVRGIADLLITECILLAVCALIWLVLYLNCRAQVRELNHLTQQKRKNESKTERSHYNG